jgi:hypothetical protein
MRDGGGFAGTSLSDEEDGFEMRCSDGDLFEQEE